MLGYVKPNIPELKVRTNELYQSAYCGLCKAMGKKTGCLSRLTLSYDFTFLVFVRLALENRKTALKKETCLVHPFRKRPVMQCNETLFYGASCSAVLTKMKLQDDINDEHGLQKLKAKLAHFLTLFFKKTDPVYDILEKNIEKHLQELNRLEQENCDSVDQVASCFGNVLKDVFSFGLNGKEKILAEQIGFHTGKWIYVVDALDDYEKDIQKNRYNPFAVSYQKKTLSQEERQMIFNALTMELSTLSQAIALIDFSECRDYEELINNIVFDGMKRQSKKIVNI